MTDTILLPKKRFEFIGAGNFGRILIERLLAFCVPATSMTVCDIE
jgi:pyrroline-5-carboxylate reductase